MVVPHQWHGAGPPLLLIAGLGARGTSWHPFLEHATRYHRVLTFDNRGAGAAPAFDGPVSIRDLARDVLDLLDDLGIERIPVMGRSLGGMIAQELALLAPERVSRLVLVSTTGRVDPHLRELFTLWAQLAEVGAPPELRHRSSLLWCLSPAVQTPEVQTYLRARIRADRPEDYALQAWACAAHDAIERLKGLRIPTLVVCGENDRFMPTPHARALAAAIPRSRLRCIPGVGHLAYLESPDRFAAEVLGFLAARPQGGKRVACLNA